MLRLLRRWNKPVIVYGDEKMRKDHPVVAFLAKENRCASLGIYKEGYDDALPLRNAAQIQTVSLRAHRAAAQSSPSLQVYPPQRVDGGELTMARAPAAYCSAPA